MIKNNNRGAGLVTVVTVLAVCGILLAGVLGFAYQFYKNAVLDENKSDRQAEIELFADLLLERSDSTDLSILQTFYTSGGETFDFSENTASVGLGDGNSLYCTFETVDDLEKWTISYKTGTEIVLSQVYYYQWSDGTCQLADPPASPQETEDATS